MFNAADAARAKCCAVHDQRVELDFSLAIQEAASTSVEGLIVFHHDHRFFDRVEGRPAPFENAPSTRERVPHTISVSFDKVVGNGPGTAVDDENWILRQSED